MSFQSVFQYDPSWPKLRLFRAVWNVDTVGDGNGYSRKLAFALKPALFKWNRGSDEWRISILGFEIHSRISWGGRFV